MTRTTNAAALAMSIVMTLTIFSSVAQLSVPAHASTDTAQVQAQTLALRG